VRFSVRDAFVHPKEAFVKFCRKAQVPEVSKRRQRTTGRMEAHGTARAEVRSMRHHAGNQVKVAALTLTRGSASLEDQN
jgi:hypothetical protein